MQSQSRSSTLKWMLTDIIKVGSQIRYNIFTYN